MNSKRAGVVVVLMAVATGVLAAGDVFSRIGMTQQQAKEDLVWCLGAGQVGLTDVKGSLKAASPAVRAEIVDGVLAFAKAYSATPEFAKAYEKSRQEAKEQASDPEEWKKEWPADPRVLLRRRISEFLEASKDVDFDAKLTRRDGKMVFVNPACEEKSEEWKLCFRAGREPVAHARAFAAAWLKELGGK